MRLSEVVVLEWNYLETLKDKHSLVPRLSTPNTMEDRVKLVHRMMSGGRLEAWHFQWTAVLCMHGAISHASRRPPDVILRTSFTRPSTALGDRRPGNEAIFHLWLPKLVLFPCLFEWTWEWGYSQMCFIEITWMLNCCIYASMYIICLVQWFSTDVGSVLGPSPGC